MATRTDTFQRVTFVSQGRTIQPTVQTWDEAQALADRMGRAGWCLMEIEEFTHQPTFRHVGPTIREFNDGLTPKRSWVFTCPCGDSDTAGTKADIRRIALLHSQEVA